MESSSLLAQFLANGLVTGASYMLVAAGLTLVISTLHIYNFAHGEFYMLGGYAAVAASSLFGLSLVPTLLFAVMCLALFGLLVERTIFRPLTGRDHSSSIIASFGLSALLQNGALVAFGAEPMALKSDLAGGPVQIGPVFLTGQRGVIGALAAHATVAQIAGVNVRFVALVTFAVSAALAGLAGALMSGVFLVQPGNGAMLVMKAFTAIILAGMGSVGGAVVAGLALGIIEALVSGYIGNGMRDMAGFFLVILMLLLRPQGLFGQSTERS